MTAGSELIQLQRASWSKCQSLAFNTFISKIATAIGIIGSVAQDSASGLNEKVSNKTVLRMGASGFAQRQIERHRRLAPVADLGVRDMRKFLALPTFIVLTAFASSCLAEQSTDKRPLSKKEKTQITAAVKKQTDEPILSIIRKS